MGVVGKPRIYFAYRISESNMTSKHVYDSSEGLVLKSLRGAAALNPSLRL